MKGHNIIKMNLSTTKTAIEYYLNNVVLKEPVIVEKVVHGDEYGNESFIVSVMEIPDPKKEEEK